MRSEDTPVIAVEDVSFSYGDRVVLEDVSLEIDAGTFFGLVGPNGSGKSTLLELMLGLQAPDSGSVELFGEPATAFADGERIGYVPQNATTVVRGMPITVREVVAMGRYPHRLFGRGRPADAAEVDAALAQL